MSFVTDKQTLDDLNILGKYRNSSAFSLFNQTRTAGGERLLEQLFQHPLTDAEAINERSAILQYFQQQAPPFIIDGRDLEATENYLSGAAGSSAMATMGQAIRRKALHAMGLKEEQELLLQGLNAGIRTLKATNQYINRLLLEDPGKHPLSAVLEKAAATFSHPKLKQVLSAGEVTASFFKSTGYDHLLRSALREEMDSVMQLIYLLDAYTAITTVARDRNFSYAKALPAADNRLHIQNGFHPAIPNAIANSMDMDAGSNVIFLTGANMAGKSTFMKTFGITLYLAHMGFPVPAKAMEFSVKEGIYTSINVPDDISQGYSHFYAEVLRVKKVAEEVASGKNLIVIFDELFKGTNVKDAYDATLAVSAAFASHENCLYIISTHIVEVGEALGKASNNIQFRYMPTVMDGQRPTYTYRAQEGISSDRHGMMIIENEGILDIILAV